MGLELSTPQPGARDFLRGILAPGHDASHIDAMNDDMAEGLYSLIQSAPPNIRAGFGIQSGTRTVERQSELFAGKIGEMMGAGARAEYEALVAQVGPVAAGEQFRPRARAAGVTQWVAPPGSSNHNHGNAADISWNGMALGRPGTEEATAWMHQAASGAGMAFPLSNEPWHVETGGVRHPTPYRPSMGNPEETRALLGDRIDLPLTETQVNEAERAAAGESPSLFEATRLAIEQSWIGLDARWTDENTPDPEFRWTDEFAKAVTQDLPEEHWDYVIDNAHSEAHAWELRRAVESDIRDQQKLGRLGGWGVALQMAAGMVDPSAIAVTVATEGLAAPYVLSAKATRMGRIIRSALLGGLSNSAVESILAATRPTGSLQDVLYAGVAGVALGGVLGGVVPGRPPQTLAPENVALGRAAAPAVAPPAGAPSTAKQTINAAIPQAPEARPAGVIASADDAGHVEFGTSTAGAAQAFSPNAPIRSSIPERFEELEAEVEGFVPFGAAVRMDANAQMTTSKNPFARWLGVYGLENAAGYVGGKIAPITADLRRSLLSKRMAASYANITQPAYQAWGREQGHGWLRMLLPSTRREFATLIAQSKREGGIGVKSIDDAARQLVETLDEFRVLAQQAGVTGFDKVARNANYVPRLIDPTRVERMVHNYGVDNVRRLVAAAIRNQVPKLTEEIADRVAKVYLTKVRELGDGGNFGLMRALSGEDREELAGMLMDNTGLKADQIDALLAHLDPDKDASAIPRGRQRTLMDEAFGMELVNKATGAKETVRVSDMWNNDMDDIFNIYSRQMTGAVSLAEMGFKNKASFQKFIADMQNAYPELHGTGYKASDLTRDLDNAKYFWLQMTGSPIDGVDPRRGKGWRMLSLARDYNFIRAMGQLGFAQAADIGNILGHAGIRTAFAAMPSFRAVIRRARGGELETPLMREIETLFGYGSEFRLDHTGIDRMDDVGTRINPTEGHLLARMETGLNVGKRITIRASGMRYIDPYLKRWSVAAISQKFTEIAFRGAKVGDRRLAAMGLSQEMLDRISAEVRTHTTVETGWLTRTKLRAINIEKWEPEAAAAFKFAVFREARRAVQESDIGSVHRWFSHPLGQILMQFRNFMFTSHGKQFLHGMNVRDFGVFAAWMASMVTAGLSYTAQTYVNSLGREDRDEWLKERLTPESIGKAAFQRAAWSALIPTAVDTLMDRIGDPVFSYRNSGLPSDSFLGNPTIDLFNRAINGFDGLVGAAIHGDQRFSQADMRNLTSLMFLGNVTGVRNIQNMLMEGLPRRSTE